MPTNITQGRTAQFIINFISSATGATIVPSSANLTINYAVNGVPAVATPSLTLQGSFYIGAWDSTPADLGIVNWSVSSPATTNPAQTGQLDIIDP